MADWNRTDFDRLDSDDRWHLKLISSDPLKGVPLWLLLYLAFALGLLVITPGLG